MDWKRVKTILIVALLFINGLLGYTYYNENKPEEIMSLDRNLVIELLNDKQVDIDTSLLDVNYDVPNISLSIQTYDEEALNIVFDRHDDYENKSISRVMKPINNHILYETLETDVLASTILTDEEVLKQAYALIDELKISREDIYIKDQGSTGKKTILTFGQKYNDVIIRDSYMIIKYNDKNLLSLERVWYDVSNRDNSQKAFKSENVALYEFIRQLYNKKPNRERALTVDNFQLVYQLKDKTTAADSSPLLSGEAFIYYEITTSDKETYLIDAVVN